MAREEASRLGPWWPKVGQVSSSLVRSRQVSSSPTSIVKSRNSAHLCKGASSLDERSQFLLAFFMFFRESETRFAF